MKTSAARERARKTLRTCRLCGHEGDDVHRVDLRGPNGRKQTVPVCEKCQRKVERENERLSGQDAERAAGQESIKRARERYREQGRS